MGWTSMHGMTGDGVEYLKQELFGSGRVEVREAARVGNAVYMAVRAPLATFPELDRRYRPDADRTVTLAVVVLIESGHYKDMDESVGPREARAPAAILDILSELLPNAEYALAWRARCRENLGVGRAA